MIAITGSESFIGSELRQRFRTAGLSYVGLDAIPSKDPNCRQGDICDARFVAESLPENTRALIHLAAISRDQDCTANVTEAYRVNVVGTSNLIQTALRRGVKQFIFASSEWVYGEVGNEGVQREDDVIDLGRVKSEYAITKAVGEQMLRLACNGSAMAATILRFGIVYGPRERNWAAVENLFFAVKSRPVIEVGSLATARRFIHLSDICSGIEAVIGRSGVETFNVSGDKLVSLRDVIEAAVKFWNINPAVVEKNAVQISIRNPDNTKMKTIVGWKPELGLEAGLKTLALHPQAAAGGV